MLCLSLLAVNQPEITEWDIDPLIVNAQGFGMLAG